MNYAYVPGEFRVRMPAGKVFVEATKGFEHEPLRAVLDVAPSTRNIDLTLISAVDIWIHQLLGGLMWHTSHPTWH
jgi:hypothetical protein